MAEEAKRLDRLRKLEKDLEKLKGPYWVEILKALLPPLISGLAILLAGYWLTGSVNNAFQKRQLQLSNAKEMQALLQQFRDGKEPESTALALSAFGEPAIVPLLYVLDQGGGDVQVVAAAEGLRAIAATEPAPVCGQLSRVLRNRTGIFSWETHLQAIKLGGELECNDFQIDLKNYEALLTPPKGGLKTYSAIVRERPAPDEGSLEDLRQALAKSQGLLQLQVLTR
jgi:hypothetical protein